MSNKVKKFDMYKFIRIVLLFTPFIMIFSLSDTIDNDTYWIIKTGEYITNNGIPVKDFLTMHTNMDLVCQQWLSSVIFYKLYDVFGFTGLIVLKDIMFIVVGILMYKLSYMISKNRFACSIAVLLFSYVAVSYFVTRPQIFTYSIVLIEIICLESYVKNGKIISLLPLPILSILEVNLHASMWTMLFILMLPYFVNALPIKIKGKNFACCKLMPLLLITVIMGFAGLVTPYGVKGLTFLFTTSIGNKVNSSIMELAPLTLSFNEIIDIIAIVAIVVFYIFYFKKGKQQAPIRYHLLILGTFIMGAMYIKLFIYFAIIGLSVSTFMIKDYKLKIKDKFKDKKFGLVVGTEIIIFVIIFIIIGSFAGDFRADNDENANSKKYIETLDEVVDVLDNEEKDNMILYNGFNSGGYLEFRGYTTYIDARADSFVEEANHDYDYLSEYYNVKDGITYYKDFYNKYGFTHLLIEKRVSPYLYLSTLHDEDYELITENDGFALFIRK